VVKMDPRLKVSAHLRFKKKEEGGERRVFVLWGRIKGSKELPALGGEFGFTFKPGRVKTLVRGGDGTPRGVMSGGGCAGRSRIKKHGAQPLEG